MSQSPRLNLEMGARRITLTGRRHRFELTDRGPVDNKVCYACGLEEANKKVNVTVPTINVLYANVALCPSCRLDYDTGGAGLARIAPMTGLAPNGGVTDCAAKEGCATLAGGNCTGGPECPSYHFPEHECTWVAANDDPTSDKVMCAVCRKRAQWADVAPTDLKGVVM